jgi:hypothetical protein
MEDPAFRQTVFVTPAASTVSYCSLYRQESDALFRTPFSFSFRFDEAAWAAHCYLPSNDSLFLRQVAISVDFGLAMSVF